MPTLLKRISSIFIAAAIVIILLILAYQGVIWLRKAAQIRFAEVHELLSEDEGNAPFRDGALDEAQIKARDDVATPIHTQAGILSWKVLAQAQMRFPNHNGAQSAAIEYTPEIKSLNHKVTQAKGFMFPLDGAGKQTHFLLSPYPSSCPYCLPAGAAELIEVKPTKPMEFTYDAIIIKGEFELLEKGEDIQQGMLYRMNDAALLSQ
jgi:hypothetical protein